ncbi:unknown [Ruminococcus sp. CAG:379]|nr:unknown [Ruminococcus sp. CAG:379]
MQSGCPPAGATEIHRHFPVQSGRIFPGAGWLPVRSASHRPGQIRFPQRHERQGAAEGHLPPGSGVGAPAGQCLRGDHAGTGGTWGHAGHLPHRHRRGAPLSGHLLQEGDPPSDRTHGGGQGASLPLSEKPGDLRRAAPGIQIRCPAGHHPRK